MTYDNTDSDADSVVDADVDNQSVSTEDLRAEDGNTSTVNRTNYEITRSPPLVQMLSEDTLNGGVNTNDDIRLKLDAGAGGQSNGYAAVFDNIFASWVYPSWEKRREVAISFFPNENSEEVLVGTGRASMRDKTQEHIGVEYDNKELIVSCGDGSGKIEETVASGSVLSSPRQFRVLIDYAGYNGGDGPADITIEQHSQGQSDTPENTWTKTFGAGDPLPSGDGGKERIAWAAGARTSNGLSTHNGHINFVHFVCYPDLS